MAMTLMLRIIVLSGIWMSWIVLRMIVMTMILSRVQKSAKTRNRRSQEVCAKSMATKLFPFLTSPATLIDPTQSI